MFLCPAAKPGPISSPSHSRPAAPKPIDQIHFSLPHVKIPTSDSKPTVRSTSPSSSLSAIPLFFSVSQNLPLHRDVKDRNVQWVFLGCPGIGKGTYASRLCHLLGVPHIATGDLVRDELSSSGPFALQLAEVVNQAEILEGVTDIDSESTISSPSFTSDSSLNSWKSASKSPSKPSNSGSPISQQLRIPTKLLTTPNSSRRKET